MSGNRKALVLGGGTGFVGQALVEVLRASGWEIMATERSDIDFAAPDVQDVLAHMADRFEPACIFNAVGYTQVDAAEDDLETAALLNKTLPAVLGGLVKTRPSVLVHFSTDFVFNGRREVPYGVDDPTGPLCVYGRTKRAGEEALLNMGLSNCIVARTAWLFGHGKKNFVRTILERCKEKRSVNVVHDQVGSPTYTLDLAQYTLKLVEAGARGLFHVVNSGQASWCDLADEAVSLAQVECTVNAVPSSAYPQKALRPAFSVLDTESLTRATGITPRPWPQALRDYIFREFPPTADNA